MSATPIVLLDTNVVIGLLKGDANATALINDADATLAEMAVSQITRMELLSFANLSELEQRTIEDLLGKLHVIGIEPAIEAGAIELRRSRKVKLPDAIIAATAMLRKLRLLTLDQALLNVLNAGL